MSTTYNPEEITPKWYKYWEENKLFHSEPDDRPSYCIVIPPPNVTGALHMGHALNNTIQDVLIRFHRMRQFNACWIPGTDHAGIATESVVAKKLHQEEGKSRHDLGREAFLKRIWEWKETYGNRILNQLKSLGCSCDWDRTCFTMDQNLSHAVKVVFLQLFQEGLIYRGKRLINWCPGCRTALSNDELVYEDRKSNFWHIKYPVKGTDLFITVATTRPETMLGDTAVAVHSRDKRYENLVGKTCLLPLMERDIPIIADDILANPEKGTGAVKVTPGHDPNDYACGMRNGLPMINILNDDGSLNENAGAYRGMNVLEARKKVVNDLKQKGLLEKIETIEHSVAHCYRTQDVIEPYLSDQWFVKMQPLVELARKAVLDKEVVFFPAQKTDDYLRWLDQTPDWCISRQIWWGHRIPIWYCKDCNPDILFNASGEVVKVPGEAKVILPGDAQSTPTNCPECGKSNLVQDPDVLDTWFSSQLWPLSTLGWPEETKELQYYYPTSVLVTARDIIALWVARMVMMGMKFRGKKPFSHVFINSTIQDEKGDIMSKSRGNGFDPVKVIEGGSDAIKAEKDLGNIPGKRVEHYPSYGCDAVRYGLMSMTSGQSQDIRLIVKRSERNPKEYAKEYDAELAQYDVKIPLFEEGSRFCNKIWQACHGVIFPNCKEVNLAQEGGNCLEDLWLSDKMHHVVKDSTSAFESYKIGEMCDILYHFFWDDLCSWYLEIAKQRLWGERGEESKKQAQILLARVLDSFLRLLHPIMPFITEELWQTLRPILVRKGKKLPQACIVASWPDPKKFLSYPESREIVELAREIVTAINNIRAEYKVAPAQKIQKVILTGTNATLLKSLEPLWEGVKKLNKIEQIESQAGIAKPERTAVKIVREILVYVPMESMIDVEKERTRVQKEIENTEKQISSLESKLSNAEYISKAPEKVVQRDKDRLEELKKRGQQLKDEMGSI